MRILVAGGAGFLGSHLVDRLLGDGHEVIVIDNFITGRRVNVAHLAAHPRTRVVDADVVDAGTVARLGDDGPLDRVYHLASPASPVGYGEHQLATLYVNAFGTRNLLELAAKTGARFLITSTSEIYGEPLVHPQREDYWGNVNPIGPRSCYDEGKRYAESLTVTFAQAVGLDVRISRLFNTYGPRMDLKDGRMVPNFSVQALAGKPITIYGDGSQTRSLCFVDDLVGGLVALMETPGIGGEVVNLGNPVEHTILEVAEKIRTAARSSSPVVFRPLPVDDPSRRRPDVDKARRLLAWEPAIGLEQGLAGTLDYFRGALEGGVRAGVSLMESPA